MTTATDPLAGHSPLRRYRIGEVAALLGRPPYVIRYWESEGVVRPRRSGSGQRVYTQKQVRQLLRFGQLRQAGYTVAGALKQLKAEPLEASEDTVTIMLDLQMQGAEVVLDYYNNPVPGIRATVVLMDDDLPCISGPVCASNPDALVALEVKLRTLAGCGRSPMKRLVAKLRAGEVPES